MTFLFSGMALGFSIAAPMGPVNVATIRRGVTAGFWAALLFGLGANCADVIYATLVFLGVVPLIEQSTVLRIALWILGAAFLIYLGISGINMRQGLNLTSTSNSQKELPPFIAGLGITLFNPTSIAFWLGIGGAFFSTMTLAGESGNALLFIAGVFIGSFLWSCILAFLLHFARQLINTRILQVISIVASLVLIAFGIGMFIQAAQMTLS